QLTSDSLSDAMHPCLNNSGQIVWVNLDLSGTQICRWDHGSLRALGSISGTVGDLQLNDQGQVLWESTNGFPRQIYSWNGTAAQPQGITPNGAPTSATAGADLAQLNAVGQVVWASYDGNDDEIYRYAPPVPGSLDLNATPVLEGGPVTGTVTL